MTVGQIAEVLDAKIICGESNKDLKVDMAFASDLMSDVLTLKENNVLLITGLANLQALRTAEMSDIYCVVFARNKKVTEEMIELAEEAGVIVLECKYSMYKTCGLLFGKGLLPVF